MSRIQNQIEIDGSIAQLTELSDTYAVIEGSDSRHQNGDACRLVVYFNLMGKRVPLKLDGEIVRNQDNVVEVMFAPPTINWHHIVRVLKGQKSARQAKTLH